MTFKSFVFFTCLIVLFHLYETNGQNGKNFIIEKFELCDDVPNQVMKLSLTPKTFITPQVVDIHFYTPVPLDSQIKISADIAIEARFGAKRWQRLVSFEDDICRIIQMYMGEMIYEIETAMGIPRGACPISRGHYNAVNYTIDFGKLKLQLPLGNMRVIYKHLKKPNKDVLLCAHIYINNS